MPGQPKRNRGKNFNNSKEKYGRSDSIDAFNTADVLPNPDPILKQVRTVWENYQEILWDPHLTTVIAARKNRTLAKTFEIEQGDASASVTEFFKEVYKGLDVYRAMSEILDSRSFGMQPMEPIWETKLFNGENKIFPVEFIGRPPYWFQYDNENKLRFRSLNNPHPGEHIEPYSLIVPRNNPKYDNPYGEALLSKVYWTVNFKKGGLKFWVEYLEKFGSPFLEAEPPRDTKDTEFDEFHDRVVEMTKGSVITHPAGAKFTVHDVKSKASGDLYKQMCDFCNAEMSKAYLGQTLTTEAGDKGARALGEVHDETKDDFTEADEILVEECFGELNRMIGDLNFGENVPVPIFKIQHEEDLKGDLAERDSKLKEQGVRFSKEYYMKNYNLEEDDIEVVEVKDDSGEDDNDDNGNQFREGDPDNGTSQQKAITEFIDSLTNKKLKKQAEFVEPVIKMIIGSNSYVDALDQLLGLFTELRPEDLETELGRAMFAAESVGRGDED